MAQESDSDELDLERYVARLEQTSAEATRLPATRAVHVQEDRLTNSSSSSSSNRSSNSSNSSGSRTTRVHV